MTPLRQLTIASFVAMCPAIASPSTQTANRPDATAEPPRELLAFELRYSNLGAPSLSPSQLSALNTSVLSALRATGQWRVVNPDATAGTKSIVDACTDGCSSCANNCNTDWPAFGYTPTRCRNSGRDLCARSVANNPLGPTVVVIALGHTREGFRAVARRLAFATPETKVIGRCQGCEPAVLAPWLSRIASTLAIAETGSSTHDSWAAPDPNAIAPSTRVTGPAATNLYDALARFGVRPQSRRIRLDKVFCRNHRGIAYCSDPEAADGAARVLIGALEAAGVPPSPWSQKVDYRVDYLDCSRDADGTVCYLGPH